MPVPSLAFCGVCFGLMKLSQKWDLRLQELTRLFNALDEDSSGDVSVDELTTFVQIPSNASIYVCHQNSSIYHCSVGLLMTIPATYAHTRIKSSLLCGAVMTCFVWRLMTCICSPEYRFGASSIRQQLRCRHRHYQADSSRPNSKDQKETERTR